MSGLCLCWPLPQMLTICMMQRDRLEADTGIPLLDLVLLMNQLEADQYVASAAGLNWANLAYLGQVSANGSRGSGKRCGGWLWERKLRLSRIESRLLHLVPRRQVAESTGCKYGSRMAWPDESRYAISRQIEKAKPERPRSGRLARMILHLTVANQSLVNRTD